MESTRDADTEEVIALLRGAVAESGLSQAAFARALGTSAPRLSTYLTGSTAVSARFLLRALRLGRALNDASTRGLMSGPVTGRAVRDALRAGDVSWAWRMLLQGRDHLRLLLADDDPRHADAWEAVPAKIDGDRWDALLAAVVAHEFEQVGRLEPAWTITPPLTIRWQPEHPFLDADRVEAQTLTGCGAGTSSSRRATW